jgi:hypothetical protein
MLLQFLVCAELDGIVCSGAVTGIWKPITIIEIIIIVDDFFSKFQGRSIFKCTIFEKPNNIVMKEIIN